jgi:hypothetical protein
MRAEKNTRKRINIRNDNKQYFISLDANWLYGGINDPDENYFIFFGTGSPACRSRAIKMMTSAGYPVMKKKIGSVNSYRQ